MSEFNSGFTKRLLLKNYIKLDGKPAAHVNAAKEDIYIEVLI